MYQYTDGNQEVTAVLFENTYRSAHLAFNLINDVELGVFVAPMRAIDYIVNNECITLRNGESVGHGEYIVKDATDIVCRYTAADFSKTYTKVDEVK